VCIFRYPVIIYGRFVLILLVDLFLLPNVAEIDRNVVAIDRNVVAIDRNVAEIYLNAIAI
jgi:hypothetical protein